MGCKTLLFNDDTKILRTIYVEYAKEKNIEGESMFQEK